MQVCIEFDDITYNILERAYRDSQEDAEFLEVTPDNSVLLDTLMYINYDYFCRNRPCTELTDYSLKLIDNHSAGSLKYLK